ncbi:glycosyltransferase family 4 protein [Prosthecomicrobium sp. N25]|uniref:glycosyltransferase family 4 protein n=1 Tax=Prosthecomicrobium sp. N25 TaxID=3129254 RepID=UPI0030781F15
MSDLRTLRILHCLRAPLGGVLRHVRDLARAQAAAGHAVGLVCDAEGGSPHQVSLLDELRPMLALGLHRVSMGRAIGLGDLVAAARIHRLAAPLAPDVLHGHGAKGGTFARLVGLALRATGTPVRRFYSPHGGSLHYAPSSLEGRVYFALERLLERATESLVFVSRFEEQAYTDKVGAPRCGAALVYNGLTDPEFIPVTPDADAADFVCVGEMRHLKGTDVLIRALIELACRGTPATAWLVGPGTERPLYERMVADAGLADRIRFRDSMPIREALALGRVAVVPSRAESLPYVVLETIAAGRPLIATAVGGIPEIFGGQSHRLVPPDDAGALAEALADARAAPEPALARAAALRAAIRPVFSTAAMAAAVEAVYRGRAEAPSVSRPLPRPAEAA